VEMCLLFFFLCFCSFLLYIHVCHCVRAISHLRLFVYLQITLVCVFASRHNIILSQFIYIYITYFTLAYMHANYKYKKKWKIWSSQCALKITRHTQSQLHLLLGLIFLNQILAALEIYYNYILLIPHHHNIYVYMARRRIKLKYHKAKNVLTQELCGGIV
jgi:uncharacterized membrane protein